MNLTSRQVTAGASRKTVFITGASSGIGEASALYFLDRGWNVVATAPSPTKFASWAARPEVAALPLDVSKEPLIAAAVAEAERRFGSVDVLINNAGIGLAGPLEAVTTEQLHRLFSVNFFGLVAVTRLVLPQMRARKAGVIINVSSVSGRVGLPFLSLYNATKFAVEGLTESLRYELEGFGIRVKLVEPGGARTAFTHEPSFHPAYEPLLSKVITKMRAGAANAPSPQGVANILYEAATDASDRLRYDANGGGKHLFLHRILPDSLWRRIVRSAFF